jgi:hypothetical protein
MLCAERRRQKLKGNEEQFEKSLPHGVRDYEEEILPLYFEEESQIPQDVKAANLEEREFKAREYENNGRETGGNRPMHSERSDKQGRDEGEHREGEDTSSGEVHASGRPLLEGPSRGEVSNAEEESAKKSETITPEQEALLGRPNSDQYPTERELSTGKGTKKSGNSMGMGKRRRKRKRRMTVTTQAITAQAMLLR